MKTVLLAIAGETPNVNALKYAVDFCKRMKARLSILQIIQSAQKSEGVRYVSKGFDKLMRSMDDTMVRITFAEAGVDLESEDRLRRLCAKTAKYLDKSGAVDIPFEIIVKPGKADRETLGYLQRQRDVIMAVYDPAARGGKPKGIPRKILENTKIPLITVS